MLNLPGVASIITRGLYGGVPTLGIIPSFFSLYVPAIVIEPSPGGRGGNANTFISSYRDRNYRDYKEYRIENLPPEKDFQLFNVRITFNEVEATSRPFKLQAYENVKLGKISINNKEIKFKIN